MEKKYQHYRTEGTAALKVTVANDPLFGSIKKAELSSSTNNLSANKDHQVFIKGTFLTTLFALVVILIGA